MPSEILSVADYTHALHIVLERLLRAHPDRRTVQLCEEARRILGRVETARLRLGVGAMEQAELERRFGLCLPAKVIAWLGACGRRLAAREFEALAAELLDLGRALEWLLADRSGPPPGQPIRGGTRLRIADLDAGPRPFRPHEVSPRLDRRGR